MIRGGPDSWNIRDRHMVETLNRLMEHHGPEAKCVVWEHNTPIGDARATGMLRAGMVNVGQLLRESRHEEEVVLIGLTSYYGTVIAAYERGGPMRTLEVPPAREESWEYVFRQAETRNQLLILDDAPAVLHEPRGHRAIGVVYDPGYERFGNYVPTVLPLRYDALLYLDRSTALHPLYV